jgi:uncharacterized protein involved in exopolysaccharide biosynthesis
MKSGAVTLNMIPTELNEADILDLNQLLLRLWRGRWWILASLALFTVMFTAVALMLTPIYRASTVLVSTSSERGSGGSLGSALGQIGSLAALAGITVGSGDTETEEALAVLRSREFTERFVSENNLLPKLFSKDWDVESGKWKVSAEDQPTLATANEYFAKKIRTVVRDTKTGLVTVQIDWRDRREAAAWANELVERLNAEMRARAISKSNAFISYLEKELSTTSLVDTRQAMNRLLDAQLNQRMLATVSKEYAFRVVDRALEPDPMDTVSLKVSLMIVLGGFTGLLMGVIAVLLFRRQP